MPLRLIQVTLLLKYLIKEDTGHADEGCCAKNENAVMTKRPIFDPERLEKLQIRIDELDQSSCFPVKMPLSQSLCMRLYDPSLLPPSFMLGS